MAKWSRLPRTRPNLPACPSRATRQHVALGRDHQLRQPKAAYCIGVLVSIAGDRGVCSTASVEQDENPFWKSRRTG